MQEPADLPILSEAATPPANTAKPHPGGRPLAPTPTFDIPVLVVLIATSTLLGGFLGYMLSTMKHDSSYADIQSQIQKIQSESSVPIKVIDVVSISDNNPQVKPEIMGRSITITAEALSKQGYLVLLGSQVYKIPDSMAITNVEIKEP